MHFFILTCQFFPIIIPPRRKTFRINRSDKIFFNIGINQISENRKLYNEIKNIQDVEHKVFSQNGEDGIIDFLLSKLNLIPRSTNFIEIGVGDYRESNTRFIYNRFHPKGLIIDCIDNMEANVKPHVNMWKGDLRICNAQINSKNINEILKNNCEYEIDLFSLDIDSFDYAIAHELFLNGGFRPKTVCVEFTDQFGPNAIASFPHVPSMPWKTIRKGKLTTSGCSLQKWKLFFEHFNYSYFGFDTSSTPKTFDTKSETLQRFETPLRNRKY